MQKSSVLWLRGGNKCTKFFTQWLTSTEEEIPLTP
jgi:hypothetical protein